MPNAALAKKWLDYAQTDYAVNVLQGYKADIIICSPMEVIDYETDE
jgi:hypothetical protein